MCNHMYSITNNFYRKIHIMSKFFNVFLSMTTASCIWASCERVDTSFDPLNLYQQAKIFDQKALEAARQRSVELNNNYASIGYDKYTEENNTINQQLRALIELLEKTPEALEHVEFTKENGGHISDDQIRGLYYFLMRNMDEVQKLDLLKDVISENLFPSSAWSLVYKAWERLHSSDENKLSSEKNDLFFEQTFYEDLFKASQKMDDFLQDGDTIVGVGNTPQFLLEAYKKTSTKQTKNISIALSGWPGRIKGAQWDFYKGLLTQQGIQNYTNYMQEVGLSSHTHHKRVFFLDIISGAGGPQFLIDRFLKSFDPGQILPEIYIMAINSLEKPGVFEGHLLKVDAVSLNMNNLAQKLDRIGQEDGYMRTAPDFPAWRWHNWTGNPVMPVGKGAQEVMDNIQSYVPVQPLYNQSLNISESNGLYSGDVMAEIIRSYEDRCSFEGGDGFKAFCDQHFDLTNLFSEKNIENARNFISMIKSDEEKNRLNKALNGIFSCFERCIERSEDIQYLAADMIGFYDDIYNNLDK